VKEKFLAELIAEERGKDIKFLFLPVGHCDLNAIELIWAFLKNKVAENNVVGGTQRVYEVTLDCIKLVDSFLWKKCISKAEEYEKLYWERDKLVERNIWDPTFESKFSVHRERFVQCRRNE